MEIHSFHTTYSKETSKNKVPKGGNLVFIPCKRYRVGTSQYANVIQLYAYVQDECAFYHHSAYSTSKKSNFKRDISILQRHCCLVPTVKLFELVIGSCGPGGHRADEDAELPRCQFDNDNVVSDFFQGNWSFCNRPSKRTCFPRLRLSSKHTLLSGSPSPVPIERDLESNTALEVRSQEACSVAWRTHLQCRLCPWPHNGNSSVEQLRQHLGPQRIVHSIVTHIIFFLPGKYNILYPYDIMISI